MTGAPKVHLVPTGTANLASIRAGLERAGATVLTVASAEEVLEVERLVLPGVGAFGAAMAGLEERGLVDALRTRLTTGRPTLAVCLGLQLLAAASDESPGVRGLGILPGRVRRLPAAPRRTHMGWAPVRGAGPEALATGWFWFDHGYALPEAPPDADVVWADHGVPFVAAFARRGLLACQHHPELGHEDGARLLTWWLERATRELAT